MKRIVHVFSSKAQLPRKFAIYAIRNMKQLASVVHFRRREVLAVVQPRRNFWFTLQNMPYLISRILANDSAFSLSRSLSPYLLTGYLRRSCDRTCLW